MRKDPKLIKSILNTLHDSDEAFVELKYSTFDGSSPKDVTNQMLLLLDGKLVAVKDPAEGEGCYPLKARITWQGCEWIEKNS